jgi:hypothetical protein
VIALISAILGGKVRMSQTIAKAITRPGIVPAFWAGFGVFAVLLAIGFVQALFSTLHLVFLETSAQDFVGPVWSAQLSNSLTGPLPFAVGVFLCIWQVAPIAPVLRLAHVVTRSILAALLGAAVIWLVIFVSVVIIDISQSSFVGGELGPDAAGALFQALGIAVGYLPVAVLAGILLWGWLQRHPLGTPVGGALDEV